MPSLIILKLQETCEKRLCIVVDTMLASVKPAIAAVKQLKQAGAKKIKFLCLLSVAEGIELLISTRSELMLYTAAIDRELSNHGYIFAAVDAAGARIFGEQ